MSIHRNNREDKVRAKAQEIYECSGGVEGRDLDNWIKAEQIVTAGCGAEENREDEHEAFSYMPFEVPEG